MQRLNTYRKDQCCLSAIPQYLSPAVSCLFFECPHEHTGERHHHNDVLDALCCHNIEGKEVGTIDLNDAVFGVEVNEHLLHMAVVNQLANKRQGTQKAKTRSEVSGGGRKPWRQKGTGHARQGSTRSPQWTGGGVVFAPTPRDYSFKLNKKGKESSSEISSYNKSIRKQIHRS